jgi:phage head maturation protease
MKDIEKNQYRSFSIESGKINDEERTVELSFSSEEPVSRYFGTEILDHKPSSVDLSRLNNNAAVLIDHGGDQVGSVVGAKIENGRGMAKIKFSRSVRGEEILQDVKDGIRTNISFGYQLNGLTLEKEEAGEDPVYRSFDWTPFEISVVAVPADATIGIGRSQAEGEKIEIETRELEETQEDISDNSHAYARLKLAKAASKGIK